MLDARCYGKQRYQIWMYIKIETLRAKTDNFKNRGTQLDLSANQTSYSFLFVTTRQRHNHKLSHIKYKKTKPFFLFHYGPGKYDDSLQWGWERTNVRHKPET